MPVSFDPDQPYNNLPPLPPESYVQAQDVALVPALISAHRALAELKGIAHSLPNPTLLLDLVTLRESQASSAIENLVTTQDELYRALAQGVLFSHRTMEREGDPVKEVLRYRQAMYVGQELLAQKKGIGTTLCTEVMRVIKAGGAGIRQYPGTRIGRSDGSTIYTPPQGEALIRTKLRDWENYINGGYLDAGHDPLVAMALAHYQFEAIHPFADGNGRTGRIVNVLHLINADLLRSPTLYLSQYINKERDEYYRGLRDVTEQQAWAPWIRFMVKATEVTARQTIQDIQRINELMEEYLDKIRATLGDRIPAERIRDLMFRHAYVKINMLEREDIAKRQTASRYLHALTAAGGGPDLLRSEVVGREVYFRNHRLLSILSAD